MNPRPAWVTSRSNKMLPAPLAPRFSLFVERKVARHVLETWTQRVIFKIFKAEYPSEMVTYGSSSEELVPLWACVCVCVFGSAPLEQLHSLIWKWNTLLILLKYSKYFSTRLTYVFAQRDDARRPLLSSDIRNGGKRVRRQQEKVEAAAWKFVRKSLNNLKHAFLFIRRL